jgi:hypothetical protein
MHNVTHEEAMEWLDELYEKVDYLEDQKIIEYIQEVLWRDNDMRTS